MTTSHPTSVDYPLGPALDFLRRLWELNHALEKVSSRMEKELGITAQQRLILRCVGTYPGITAGHLATLLCLDRGTISASLGRLESKGLLDRRPDPRDKRRVSLGLTAKGHALDHPSVGTVEAAVERLLTVVPSAAVESMALVLDQLTALLAAEAERKA